METIRVLTRDFQTLDVEAEPVTFAGFEGFRFAVHPSLYLDEALNIWSVTEVTTGAEIAYALNGCQSAIEAARRKLKYRTPLEITNGINRVMWLRKQKEAADGPG